MAPKPKPTKKKPTVPKPKAAPALAQVNQAQQRAGRSANDARQVTNTARQCNQQGAVQLSGTAHAPVIAYPRESVEDENHAIQHAMYHKPGRR